MTGHGWARRGEARQGTARRGRVTGRGPAGHGSARPGTAWLGKAGQGMEKILKAPLQPCAEPGCRVLSRGSWCEEHGKAAAQRRTDRRRAYNRARGHSGMQGYGHQWRKVRDAFLREHAYCGCGARATEVDHIVPRKQGGTDEPGNLRAMCRVCHSRKTVQEDGGFGR